MTGCSCLPGPQPGLLGHALRYQQQGYAVLPLVPGGKKPHPVLGNCGGVYHATRDPALPRQWWARDRTANIGVATGAVNQLVVIDLDVKGTADGTRNFWDWLRDNGHDGQAYHAGWPWARTPSGGRHFWFRTPPGAAVPQRIGILPGVDIKGDGGYVAAPPSVGIVQVPRRPGERKEDGVPLSYRWEAGCPCSLPDAPGWMADWVTRAPEPQEHPDESFPVMTEYAWEQLLATLCPGNRNIITHRLACSLFRRYGTGPGSEERVTGDLAAEAARRGVPPLSAAELAVITDSARRFVQGCQQRDENMHVWKDIPQVRYPSREMIIWHN